MPQRRIGYSRERRLFLPLVVLLVLILFGARSAGSWIIEYEWWKEMGQVSTWISMLLYGTVPVVVASVIAFMALWVAHARGMKFAGASIAQHAVYFRIATLAVLLLGVLVAASTIENWTVIRYIGGRNAAAGSAVWTDPVFGRTLSFYLFELPFYSMLRRYLLGLLLLAAAVYWITARGWQLRANLPQWRDTSEIDPAIFRLEGGLSSPFVRGVAGLILLAFAFRFFLGRYEMLWNEHGFMVGADYVDERIRLPLQWVAIGVALISAGLVWSRRWVIAGVLLAAVLVVRAVVPFAVAAAYVRPNEISLERPYVDRHIQATRSAYALSGPRVKEGEFATNPNAPIDFAKNRPLLENVRLWDWRAFYDTVSQIQALRPYYVFVDADVDRYVINGALRQVLLTPRELDIRQLSDAQTRWINPHFIYTHGYGLVMAEANRITADGLPYLFIEDAPARVGVKDLKLTRPEIYYGEVVHEPVFVRTAQAEFNYPSGAENVFSRYEGQGGFPVSSLFVRVAAALSEGDFNILLTGYLTGESRMMIHRKVRDRLETLAGFINWDTDPYLVLTDDGRMVWTVDGYTTSDAHPYSSAIETKEIGRLNYIRNSVKATIDAYDGTARLYVFDPADPIIQAYWKLFPNLLRPASEMPPSLRAHARYPEGLFRVQSEMYRLYHMLDPQAFYNKEDVWNIARTQYSHGERPDSVSPTYVVATLPGETAPEFLLVIPFTPRNKDNMVGLMVARCDGPHLGEVSILRLSKQELIFGPMQIEARINQDQNISKDLTLWNQQGSQVLRGQMLVLPVGNNFLYVEPIYIQASEARMPQLKKIVLATGSQLVYKDTYEAALAELTGTQPVREEQALQAPPGAPVSARVELPSTAAGANQADLQKRLEAIRRHLGRYKELAGQGKWSEAGKELEAMEAEAGGR